MRHDVARLDPFGRTLAALLDGTRDRRQLLAHLQAHPPGPDSLVSAANLAAALDDQLARLAASALLQA